MEALKDGPKLVLLSGLQSLDLTRGLLKLSQADCFPKPLKPAGFIGQLRRSGCAQVKLSDRLKPILIWEDLRCADKVKHSLHLI